MDAIGIRREKNTNVDVDRKGSAEDSDCKTGACICEVYKFKSRYFPLPSLWEK